MVAGIANTASLKAPPLHVLGGGSCRTIEPDGRADTHSAFHWLLECACGRRACWGVGGGNPTSRSRPSPSSQRQSQRLLPPTPAAADQLPSTPLSCRGLPRHNFYCLTCWSCSGSGASQPASCCRLKRGALLLTITRANSPFRTDQLQKLPCQSRITERAFL